jgi:putative Ig domain-containing protein/IPT/TIG domain-containing protein
MAKTSKWVKSNSSALVAWIVAAVAIAIALITYYRVSWELPRPWLLVAIGVVVVAYFLWKIRASALAEDSAPMPLRDRRFLTGYLLVLGLIIVFMLVSLNSIDFPEAAVEPEQPLPQATPVATPNQNAGDQSQTPRTAPAANQTPAIAGTNPPPASPTPIPAPLLQAVFPHHTLGNKVDEMLTLYGQNFRLESVARFDTKEVPTKFISSNLLTATLPPSHLANVGSLTVDVKNRDNSVSNAITVPIARPKVHLNLLLGRVLITREVQLLLIVLFAGALGSYVHALKSLGDFIGNRTLKASWFWWYITRPFLGMAMALIFYAVLRGGFLAGTPADAKIVSAFGVLTVGALVGMFADKAAQKLAEVFDVVFKAPDTRGGKLDAPVIDSLTPGTVPVGATSPIPVTISGSRLGKVSAVRVNGDERKPDKLSEKEVTFTLKPDDMKKAGQLSIEAVNPDGGVSPSAKLFVSDIAISTTALTDAKVGVAYTQKVGASGGAASKKWSLVEGPKWLKIDDNGNLSGTPKPEDVKEINNVTVKVVDKEGASTSNSFNLKVVG